MAEHGPPCNREHGPNPYLPDTFLHAHWELRRALRDLGRAVLRAYPWLARFLGRA